MSEITQKVANAPLGSFPVKCKEVNDGRVQYVQLDIGNSDTSIPVTDTTPLPVNVMGSSPATIAVSGSQTVSTVSSTSSQIIASNTSRAGAWIHVPSTATQSVYLSLNNPATLNDIEILPGGDFYVSLGFGGPPLNNAVYGIVSSGTQDVIIIEG